MTSRTTTRIALAAVFALGALLAAACDGGASDAAPRAERVGSTTGIPTGPAVTVPEGHAPPRGRIASTGAWVPDNGRPSLVFVDAIW